MPPLPPVSPPPLAELSDLLAALRLSGVPIGPGELARLQHVFARKPRLQRADLYHLLRALLIKTPAQLQVFEPLFADWCPDHTADWPAAPAPVPPLPQAQTPPPPAPRPQAPPPTAPPRRRWLWLLGAGVALLGGIVLLWPSPPVKFPLPPPPPVAALPDTTGAAGTSGPVAQVWLWRAHVDPQAIYVPPRLSALPLALLGLTALALAGVLWRQYRRNFPRLGVQQRHYVGARWQPLPPPARDDSALLSVSERRQLVWQIEQFVADEPTHRLHLPQTVAATARAGGWVRLHFQPAVYERDVWFWRDRHLRHATPRTAIAQLLATLSVAGLQAREGLFTDVPDCVDWPEQPGYQPEYEEGAGCQALVVIYTDGAGLEQRLASQRAKRATERLLRSLQRWPRLCFVECDPRRARLAGLLEPYGLETIALEEVPAWLGGVGRPGPADAAPSPGQYGSMRLWAAAVALGGAQADRASAQSLRVALRLPVSPWAVEQVLDMAQQPEERQRLITWLLHREAHETAASLAQQAIAWWQRRYQEAAQRLQAQENRLLPWTRSLAHQRWQMELALLHLLTEPEAAAKRLAQLADATLRADIQQRLAEYATATQQDALSTSPRIVLPWSWNDLTLVTQYRLRSLGFAVLPSVAETPPAPKDAPRLVLVCTLLLALALAAGIAALAPDPPPHFLCGEVPCAHPAMVVQTVQDRERTASGTYQVTLGSARDSQLTWLPAVPVGAQIPVTWTWQPEPNAIQLPGSRSVILRAGRLAQPIRACSPGWRPRALVILAMPDAASRPALQQLAMQLLDKGSADQVWLGADWAEHLDAWLGPSPTLNRATQLLVLLPDATAVTHATDRLATHAGPWAVATMTEVAGLQRALDFAGIRRLEAVSPALQVQRQQGQVWLAGGPEQQPGPAGLVWVQVCPGTFTMGTLDKTEDPMAYDDEILPAPRIVVLSALQIAQTETTQQQVGGTGNLPVIKVDWAEARAACQRLGGDLPSEAQWEYAARAGSRFPWSFGDDVARLGTYAWYRDNANKLQEVRQKQPNPLGLYDMHGNAWEWTRDWYGAYAAGVVVDPLGASYGTFRVIRGGSAWYPPEVLRSAHRVGILPEFQVGFLGFRCVRVPPQP